MEQNRAEAVKWFRKAATGGHSRGQHNLAVAHHNDGALVVIDEIAPGLPLPLGARHLGARRAVHAARGLLPPRGDPLPHVGGRAAVLGDADQQRRAGGPPPTVTFIATEEWIQVEIRLGDFATAPPEVIAGLAFVAEGQSGASSLRWMRWRRGKGIGAGRAPGPIIQVLTPLHPE
ncbi:MAG: hypothetical protein OXP28_16455 [Gammaproteobacteria bacterium]|nr:hypothetical protein [Gammaproteobacteria bacterium]